VLATATAANWATFITLSIVVFGGGYYVSLLLHPNRNCPTCNGGGKHRGAIFTYSHRQCRRCGGKGRLPRLGTLIRCKLSGKELPP